MTNLEKNIIQLQEKIYALNVPDISKSFLSDSEVAKLIILSKNLKMSKADADIMIDGKISELTKISLAAEIRAKRLAENLANQAATAAQGAATSAAQGAVGAATSAAQGAVGAATSAAQGAVGGDATSAAQGAVGAVGGAATSAAQGAASAAQNAANNGLVQGQNILSDSVGNNFTINNPTENMLEDTLEDPLSLFSDDDEDIQREVDLQISIKEDTAKFARENGIYPLPKNSSIHDEAKKIKTQVREKFMMLIKEQKELVQDLAKTAISSGNSIAAASVLVAPVSFNVPAALVLVLTVIDAIGKIISKTMSIILQLEPLKLLILLLPKDAFETITAPINIAILAIISILEVVGGFQKLIQSLMGKLKDNLKPENLKSQIKELTKQITEKEKEKEDLIKDQASQNDIDLKSDEIKELKDRLKIMIEGPKLPEMENGEFKVPASFEDLLKSIDNTLETDKNTISSLNLQFFDYVYDVKLPDNTIVKGISEEELEYYKLKYSIILDAQNSD